MLTREKEQAAVEVRRVEVMRPKRAKITEVQAIERMKAFEAERKEHLIAAVRKSQD